MIGLRALLCKQKSWLLVPFMLLLLILDHTARAQDEAAADAQPQSRWIPPQPEQAKVINEAGNEPARVRIGLRLTQFQKVVSKTRTGQKAERFMPSEPLRHTLKARLNKTNHFFVGEWHIETRPVRWIKKTRRYDVRLNLYRRYGAFGQLEENIGFVDLSGVLDEQEKNVHVLLGVARKRIRDKFGNPLVDVVAGFAPGAPAEPKISQSTSRPAKPAEAPATYSGELIRGRF